MGSDSSFAGTAVKYWLFVFLHSFSLCKTRQIPYIHLSSRIAELEGA